ncbi:DHHC palmitoyltransferase-domain-containing protein [Cladochytrium replicatum]|nr:DHHC palmitoyltransferase-domain-containing protein [Cladochytrium replicatum]
MAADIWTIAAASTALFLMTFIPFTSRAYIFSNWLSYKTPNAPWLLLIPFDIAIISTWLNYFLTLLTDPGKVPKGYDPARAVRELDLVDGASIDDGKTSHASSVMTLRARPVVQELKKSSGKPRWCQKCMTFKPPRTHHCSYCKRCVLKMDHHCPWVGNCVGHYNHGYFVRFLISVTFSAVYCLALIGWRMADLIRSQSPSSTEYYNFATGEINPRYFYTPPAGNKEVLFMIIDIMLLFILLFTVGMMMGFHIYYACSNVTTIEHEENNTIAKLIRRKQISKDYQYPYDLGWYSNLSMLFGTRWWPLWFVPLPPPRAYDGTAFAVNAKLAKDGQPILWPPPEYHEYRQNPYRRRYEDLSSSSEGDPGVDSGSTDEEGTAGENVRLHDLEGSGSKYGRRHVRRSSDGYVVRDLTEEDRERMVKEVQERNEKLYASYGRNGLNAGGHQIPSVQHSANSHVGSSLAHSNSSLWDEHEAVDDVSENEVLGMRQRRESGA